MTVIVLTRVLSDDHYNIVFAKIYGLWNNSFVQPSYLLILRPYLTLKTSIAIFEPLYDLLSFCKIIV